MQILMSNNLNYTWPAIFTTVNSLSIFLQETKQPNDTILAVHFVDKRKNTMIWVYCYPIPYRAKHCRAKSDEFFESDENFSRRKFRTTKCRPIR